MDTLRFTLATTRSEKARASASHGLENARVFWPFDNVITLLGARFAREFAVKYLPPLPIAFGTDIIPSTSLAIRNTLSRHYNYTCPLPLAEISKGFDFFNPFRGC